MTPAGRIAQRTGVAEELWSIRELCKTNATVRTNPPATAVPKRRRSFKHRRVGQTLTADHLLRLSGALKLGNGSNGLLEFATQYRLRMGH